MLQRACALSRANTLRFFYEKMNKKQKIYGLRDFYNLKIAFLSDIVQSKDLESA